MKSRLVLWAVCVTAGWGVAAGAERAAMDKLEPEDLPRLLELAREAIEHVESALGDAVPIQHLMNMALGVFLFKVNVESALGWNFDIPDHVEDELQELSFRSEHIKDQLLDMHWNPVAAQLLSSSTVWAYRLRPFLVGAHDLPAGSLGPVATHAPWSPGAGGVASYLTQVSDYLHPLHDPSPKESDECLRQVLRAPVQWQQLAQEAVCRVHAHCLQLAFNGTHFGYFASHRVLMLLVGELDKGCSAWQARGATHSAHELGAELCGELLLEAELLFDLDFPDKTVDLFFELMALCSLYGDSAWVRRSWVLVAKRLSRGGCHKVPPPRAPQCAPPLPGPPRCRNETARAPRCHHHLTGVVLGALGAAVRYSVETQYELLDSDISDELP